MILHQQDLRSLPTLHLNLHELLNTRESNRQAVVRDNLDLAKQLIEMHGQKHNEDIEIKFTGLNPGEKLFEEINHKRELLEKTSHPKILRFISQPVRFVEVCRHIDEIQENIHQQHSDQLKMKFKKPIPEYQPYLN